MGYRLDEFEFLIMFYGLSVGQEKANDKKTVSLFRYLALMQEA